MYSMLCVQKYQLADTDDHQQLFDLLAKMLKYETSCRLNLTGALRHPFFHKLPPELRGASAATSRAKSYSLSR